MEDWGIDLLKEPVWNSDVIEGILTNTEWIRFGYLEPVREMDENDF